MEMSIRFPGLNLVLEYVPASFTIFGMEFTIYGVLIAIGAHGPSRSVPKLHRQQERSIQISSVDLSKLKL